MPGKQPRLSTRLLLLLSDAEGLPFVGPIASFLLTQAPLVSGACAKLQVDDKAHERIRDAADRARAAQLSSMTLQEFLDAIPGRPLTINDAIAVLCDEAINKMRGVPETTCPRQPFTWNHTDQFTRMRVSSLPVVWGGWCAGRGPDRGVRMDTHCDPTQCWRQCYGRACFREDFCALQGQRIDNQGATSLEFFDKVRQELKDEGHTIDAADWLLTKEDDEP